MEQNITMEKIQKQSLRRQKTVISVTYVLLSFWALMVLFPFYWMLLTSIKSYGSYNSEYYPKFFASSPTL